MLTKFRIELHQPFDWDYKLTIFTLTEPKMLSILKQNFLRPYCIKKSALTTDVLCDIRKSLLS